MTKDAASKEKTNIHFNVFQSEEIFLDMFEDEYREMTVSTFDTVNLFPSIYNNNRLLSLICLCTYIAHDSHMLEKYLNLEGFHEKSLKITSDLKSTGKSLKSLKKSLNSTIFCRTYHC